MLSYRDGPAAIDWLTGAFGFVDTHRIENDGVIAHAELETGSGIVMLLSEPEAGPPGRRYRVEDIEGHRWMFMQRPPD
jgi:uncharacterized glyoxalase superfamily protein PhnB